MKSFHLVDFTVGEVFLWPAELFDDVGSKSGNVVEVIDIIGFQKQVFRLISVLHIEPVRRCHGVGGPV